MKAKKSNGILHNSIFRVVLGTAAILLVPLILRWPWSVSDFVVMGVLIFGAGSALELVRTRANKKYRLAIAAAVIIAFLLIWMELAVGLFGSPFAGS